MAQQLQVTFPRSRMVFQRNNGNEARLWIGGYYSLPFSRIQVRAEPMEGGTLLDWTTLQENPKGGAFAGSVTVKGGWYRLRIRGLQGEQYIEGGGVERIGVGEVFVIAGQSNAQGFLNFGERGASSDRVSCVNFGIGSESSPFDPNTLEFSHLDAGRQIFPRGKSAWCWGVLGDRLVERLGVPVLFFNAAWQGSSSKNWRESADGIQTTEEYTNTEKYPVGQPYGNLKTALNYYVQMLGIRAILWHQGEADNFFNRSIDDYAGNLSRVITRSREHSAKDISWVVSRASYSDPDGTDDNVIAGQNRVIQTVSNVFAGPETDRIQIPRAGPYDSDRVHFHDNGLVQLADAWNNSLNDGFFQNSRPQAPAPGATLSVSCAGSNTLSLKVDGNYTSFNWDGGGNSQTINVGTGRYMATVKDALGNTVFTAPYQVPERPTITANGPTTFCEGANVTLTSTYDNTFWSNNATGKNVAVSAAGTYRAVYRDAGNCEFTSNEITVNVNPLPTSPTVRNLGQARFCDRNATTLEATDALTYNWSTGEKTKQIEVRRGGTYSLTVTDQNGCTSKPSNQVAIIVDPLPNRPTISAGGPTTFCADQTVTLTSTAEANYVWESGQTSRSVTTNQPGNYLVRTRNIYNCLSDPSNTISIQVNPLPTPPTVTVSGSTTFCDGERVTLTASSPLRAFWNVGDSTQSIVATRANTYTARVRDANGCFSPPSAGVVVDVKPVPSVPTIKQIGTYTLEAAGTRQGDYYAWERDNVAIEPREPIIKANQTGSYRTRAYLAYGSNLVCASDFSAPIAFTLIIDNEGLSIYPNPSPDKEFTLETLDDLTDATLTLMTLSGQVLWKTTVENFNERKTWNLSTVPAGHYILNVRSATFNVSKRLLIGL
ncbi:putative secreted protein (Por secretion system target) [Larkinella arboricola]|uniref:Putative secreted protein (Por secretion system target) n=1 Tax=Larkinella arboricola TaxID=643671 RepID=A0A327WYU6_LARAB|nr:T9SS type A sorting domain-containing protein [Larkinella arboricola]RAJ97720.1 putative secreted protein (Por secretion system target) [Larkinella arboricola]